MAFSFSKTFIPGVVLIKPGVYEDDRGFFVETYKKSEFLKSDIPDDFVQDNYSWSNIKGMIRGLHFQTREHAQAKLVRCVYGEIWDVAVDIRPGSPSFGDWVGFYLSAANKMMLYIPPGFAHGFQVTSNGADVIYKCSAEYSAEHEAGIIWNDSDLAIGWPIEDAKVFGKDSQFGRLSDLID